LAIAFHDISLGLEKKRVKRRKKGTKLSGAGGESGKKSTSPPNLSGVDYITTQPMKWYILHLNFLK
jgi:hypothetical protein